MILLNTSQDLSSKHEILLTIRLNDYMPPEFVKSKDAEKKMYMEHKKLQGVNELNAKYRYVQLCRSLKTYGISFFMVKVIPLFLFIF